MDKNDALYELTVAKDIFFNAIAKFERKVDLKTVSTDDWIDEIDYVICDIESEISNS